ncbi:MAG: ABC transporter transmembrane domain-containing protein [Hyphomonadaceae bacterium]
MTDETNTIVDDRRASEPVGGAAKDRPKGRSLKPLAMLWPYVKRHPITVITALVFLLLGTAVTLSIPLLLGDAVDVGLGGDLASEELIAKIDSNFSLVFLAVVALGVIGAVRFYFISRFGERVAADLRNDLYGHMLSLSPRFHANMRSGEAVSRLTADITLLETFLGSSTSLGVRTLLNTAGALGMMLVVSWKLGGSLLVMLPVAILPVLFVGRIIRNMSNRAQTRLSEAGAEGAEALDAVELIQAYGRERSRRKVFSHAVEATFQAAMRRNGARAGMMVLVSIVFMGGVVGVLWLGARWVTTGAMSGGQLASLILYALYAGSGFGMLAEVYGEVMRAAGAADRSAEIFAAEPEIRAPEHPEPLPSPVQGALVFDNVDFAYGDEDLPALNNFTLNVAPGEFIALVGPSGAGKSTVFRLALRLFDPDSGAVKLDGLEAPRTDPKDWRRQFAYAPQESTLFTGTARENIAFGDEEANDESLRDAASRAEAWGFLNEKGGLEAVLGSKGRSLSGGQRQRVALARALVRDAPVLLLDEATSALDSESEALVQKALEAAASGRTTLAIAHRLSTVRKADRIVVMDEGRVVETGDHETLVAKGGLYARLAEIQFGEH